MFVKTIKIESVNKNLSVFILMLIISTTLFANETFTLEGEVVDVETGEPIPYVTIYLKEADVWQFTNQFGLYTFKNIEKGKYTIVTHCLGYNQHSFKIDVNNNSHKTLELYKQNLELQEVVVTATEKASQPGTSVINQQAMQHIQPSGFGDLLELLPGHRWQDINMSQVNSISLRQAGSDENTTFGTSFYVDGMPVGVDGGLEGGILRSGDLKLSGRLNVGSGVDMREIPTDDIESIEVIRGVPSVRHGNLSTGAVVINRKWGTTPLTVRVKSDLKTKLASINKGVRLGDNRGVLNVGTEVVSFVNDPRNPLESYLRNKTSLKYSNSYNFGNSSLRLNTGIDYLITIDEDKEDPELNYGLKDYYRSNLSKLSYSLSSSYNSAGNILKSLTFSFRADYSKNSLKRERLVALTGPVPQPTSIEPGKRDGEYLPSRYKARFERDDQPFSLFSSIHFSLSGRGDHFQHRFNGGADWRYIKNFGKGDIYDISRPIYAPSRGRPYDFSSVPGLHNISFFGEEELSWSIGNSTLKVTPGVRVSMLSGLSADYDIKNKMFTDFRGHIIYSFPQFNFLGNNIKVSLNGAIGEMTRMPALSHLYPQENYYDIIELNYYAQDPELRRLYVNTQIKDITNYNLQPAKNFKKEVGIDIEVGKTRFLATIFNEEMTNGIMSASRYIPFTYKSYDPSSVPTHGLSAPPDLDMFEYEERSRLYSYSQYINGSDLNKKGVEYQLISPRIERLQTRISISGAWFKTRYHISQPEYTSRSFIYKGKEYPYVGVFERGRDSEERELHNTNIQFDTHLPSHRLLFTISVQSTWYEKSRRLVDDGTPTAYLDNYGNYHKYSSSHQEDPMLRLLMRSYTSYYFDTNRRAIDVGVNLKLKKEIGDNMSFSFFVNRIMNYLPDYTTPSGTVQSRRATPYFGMEFTLSI
ncbi:carboxypeptidase-like regulatory domain-containing protein [Marinilabiliaceae bacterium ANBcel2]|nr:carboxypeptidase-like regulatory domain-containing protein [Marinilabiliaceae bacterium ANBcel2]